MWNWEGPFTTRREIRRRCRPAGTAKMFGCATTCRASLKPHYLFCNQCVLEMDLWSIAIPSPFALRCRCTRALTSQKLCQAVVLGSWWVDKERLDVLQRLGLPGQPFESTPHGVWVPTLATSNGRACPTASSELDRGCDIRGDAKVKGHATVSRVAPTQFFANGEDQRQRAKENRGHGSVSSPDFAQIGRENLFGQEHSHHDAANSQSWTERMLAKAQFIASVDRLTLQKVRPPDEEREAEVHTYSHKSSIL